MAWLSHLMLATQPAIQPYFTSHCAAVVIILEDEDGKTAPRAWVMWWDHPFPSVFMSAIITSYKLILLREGLFPTHSLPLCNDSSLVILCSTLGRMQIPKQSAFLRKRYHILKLCGIALQNVKKISRLKSCRCFWRATLIWKHKWQTNLMYRGSKLVNVSSFSWEKKGVNSQQQQQRLKEDWTFSRSWGAEGASRFLRPSRPPCSPPLWWVLPLKSRWSLVSPRPEPRLHLPANIAAAPNQDQCLWIYNLYRIKFQSSVKETDFELITLEKHAH